MTKLRVASRLIYFGLRQLVKVARGLLQIISAEAKLPLPVTFLCGEV
jgi:hypothetical protein